MYNKSLFLQEGTEVRLVPSERIGGKALYVSKDGRCFSFYHERLRHIKPQATNSNINRHNGRRKQKYLCMRSFGHILVHHAVHLAWIGPIPDGCVVDHINGITTDNRAKNLETVTPAENRKRAQILRAMRKTAEWDNRPDLLPENRPIEELKSIFKKYELVH